MDTANIMQILQIVLLSMLLAVLLISIVCYVTRKAVSKPSKSTTGKNWLEKFRDALFSDLPKRLNQFIRCLDFTFSKSYGHAKTFRFIFKEGYPKSAYILVFAALFFLFGGLNPGLKKELLFAFVMALAVTIFISNIVVLIEKKIPKDVKNVFLEHVRYHALHVVSAILIILISIGIWCYVKYNSAPVLFYKHIHIPIIIVLLALSLLGILVRCVVFKKPQGYHQFSEHLQHTQLEADNYDPKSSWISTAYGLITGPTYHLLKLLLLPAWIIIWLPTSWMENWLIYSLLAASWLLLSLCTVHRHLHFFLNFIDRWFLTGAQLFVSLLIIILAFARIFNISYIATLLDGAPIHHVLFFMAAGYTALLFYEFLSNNLLSHHLIYYLRETNGPPGHAFLSRIPYRFSEKTAGSPAQGTPYFDKNNPPEYCLQLYSGARFALVKWNACGDPDVYGASDIPPQPGIAKKLQAIFEKREIFGLIAGQHKDLQHIYSDLSKRVKLYFTIQNLLLLAVVVMTVFWILAQEPKAILSAKLINEASSQTQRIDLRKLVMANAQTGQPAIFIAASGGGTRAAIYTTALLAALREKGQLKNVVLASGVSGGGMSLAYFAANRDYLLSDLPESCADPVKRTARPNTWCDYIDVVVDNHIRYVSSRIGNTEIFTDTSLGQYLADSFAKTFILSHKRKQAVTKAPVLKYYTEIDSFDDMGLILNTALVAHPYSDSTVLENVLSEYEKAKYGRQKDAERFYKLAAGGRVVFSNIANISQFPGIRHDNHMTDAMDVEFKYLIGGGKHIPLPTIGALTANFPPVFPNAIVKLDEKRYRITDGGAVENRGIISLLYAIRSMLEEMSQSELHKLPVMHIVMAEASGESIDYKNYMTGLTAKASANVMIANQLILEIKGILTDKCSSSGCADKLQYHYLSMPLMMRARGGLGTHWKMPSKVTFTVPSAQNDKPDTEVPLNGHDTICLIQELFSGDISKRSAPKISVNISTESEHVQCQATKKDSLLWNAFLSQNVDVQAAWLRFVKALPK